MYYGRISIYPMNNEFCKIINKRIGENKNSDTAFVQPGFNNLFSFEFA